MKKVEDTRLHSPRAIDSVMILNKVIDIVTYECLYMERHPDLFPPKESFLVNSGKYVNVMCGQNSRGVVASKTIYVNEAEGILDATMALRFPDKEGITVLDAGYLTILRSALFAAYAVLRSGHIENTIGLIGGGKINLMTAAFLKLMGVRDIVLLGGRQRPDKNAHVFTNLTGLRVKTGMENLKDCGVLISCTTNNEEKDMIKPIHAPNTTLVIAQDGGFTLSPEWRKHWKIYTDHPTQLAKHWDEEFPYDHVGGGVLHPLYKLGYEKNVGVYLYGTITADIIAAQWQMADTIPDMFIHDYLENLKLLE